MTKLLQSCVVAVISSFLAHASLADVLTNPEEICKAAQERGGIWFDDTAAAKCAQCEIDLASFRAEVANFTAQRDNLVTQVESLENQLAAAKVELTLVKKQLAEQTAVNAEQEHKLGAWYRKPIVVGLLGVSTGVLAAGAIVITLVTAVN